METAINIAYGEASIYLDQFALLVLLKLFFQSILDSGYTFPDFFYLTYSACSLVNNDTKQFIISSETDAIREAEDRVRCTYCSLENINRFIFIFDGVSCKI